MATMTLSDMRFTSYSTKTALQITSGGTYTLDNCFFDGSGTYEVEVSSAVTTPTTIILQNGTTALAAGDINNLGSSSVTIQNNVDLTITVLDISGSPIQNAQTAIYQTSDKTQLMNEDTNASGVATESFNFSSNTDIYYRVRKSSTGATRYFNFSGTGTITSAGFSATVTLYEDTTAS